jgi:hypothetical protein
MSGALCSYNYNYCKFIACSLVRFPCLAIDHGLKIVD